MRASGDEPELARARNGSELRMNSELDQNGADVVAHGRLGEPEAACDLPRRVAVGDKAQHLELARGQADPGWLLEQRDRSRGLQHVQEEFALVLLEAHGRDR